MVISLKKQIDFYREFKSWYSKIVKDFKFDSQKDFEARNYLSQILKKKSDWNLNQVLMSFEKRVETSKYLVIYGCGPSLKGTVENIVNLKGKNNFNKWLNLAADGASRLLKEQNIFINAIFTDLDGITKEEFQISEFMIVHAHGDNISRLEFFQDEILQAENLIGTTQVEPNEYLVNPGGFTDGDRILFFLKSFLKPFHEIFCIGMDFKDLVGEFSKPEFKEPQQASQKKIKKLEYAVKIIEWLANEIENPIYFINSEETSKNFKYLSLNDFVVKISNDLSRF